MARILEFTVEGLAGRSEPLSRVLNRDANIFFGLNGSGKTTLLKILHSALSTDTQILKNLPFSRASVKIYFNRYEASFIRTIEQREKRTNRAIVTRETLEWSSEPLEPDDGFTTYRKGFLPISRLYRNVATATGTRRLSDQELDDAFARGLQAQWSEYYADTAQKITKAQEMGFANILRFFLAGTDESHDESAAPSETEAYQRIIGFLERQPGFEHLLPEEKEFSAIYKKRKELRNVVQQIETVEKNIADITAPRERYRNVLESMFTGGKHLVFTEKEIKVELSDDKEIGLTLLSSGEKQLLFIALNALLVGNSCLIIDEPELSMHVDWQTKLIATLSDLNPRLQLIVATHSPEIMANVSDDKIFRI